MPADISILEMLKAMFPALILVFIGAFILGFVTVPLTIPEKIAVLSALVFFLVGGYYAGVGMAIKVFGISDDYGAEVDPDDF